MNSNQAKLLPNFSTIRYLLLATALLAFSIIVIGVVLRISGPSTACTDWPTCSSGLIEPFSSDAFLPFIHRIAASLAAILLVFSLVFVWIRYRSQGWIVWPLSTAAILLFSEIILGRVIAVQSESAYLSSFHFAIALGVLALTVIPLVILFKIEYSRRAGNDIGTQDQFPITFKTPFSRLSLVTFLATIFLFISGSWVTASGAQLACPGWPLCGDTVPADSLAWVSVFHRLITLGNGILIFSLVWQAWRTQRSQTSILVSTTAAGVLFFSQAIMGGVESALNYPASLVGLHAVTASAVWVVIIVQITLVGLSKRSAEEERQESMLWGARDLKVLLKDYLLLTKPIVVALLLVTTFAGMVVGGQSWPAPNLVFWTLLGGFLAAGGSGAINQYIDRIDDQKMQRTASRPIPSGRLTPGEGLAFGVASALLSFYIMVSLVNFLAALLTLAGIIYYVLLYSLLLKKTTVQNIVIGGGAGAIPPLVGWAAATGSLNVPALFLFAVVFMWTPPHFWALALVRRNDYARAGVPMLPVVRGERETRWQIFLYTIELVILTLVLPLFGLGGGIYFVAAILLGALLLYSAWKVWRGEGNKVAWKMYRHSSMYLAFLFLALMVDALV